MFIVNKAIIGIRGFELKIVRNGEYRQPSNIAHYCPIKPVFIHIAHYCPVGRVILILPGFLPTLFQINIFTVCDGL